MDPDYIKLREIKPALSGYIRNAQTLLKRSVVPDEEVIHDVRVLMKKSRAVLKLIANQFDKEIIEREIHSFREVGRIMCSWREIPVHRKTLKELRKENPGIFLKLSDNEILAALMKKPEPAPEPSAEMKTGLKQIADLLQKSGYRIRFQTMNKLDPQILIRELELTYSDVIDVYLTCRNNQKPENIHELRKRAKDFLYQIFFFRPLNPSRVKSIERRLDMMTQNLGKFNDLTQLLTSVGYKYYNGENTPAMDELVIKIREKQDRYLSRVWPVAYKIFCPGQNLINVLGFKLLII
jgi:CHAD domain-containing protein